MYVLCYLLDSRSQWPRGLRRRSVVARLWVRIPPDAWVFVCCECCVLSGRGLCDKLITTYPEESYRLWRIVLCDLDTSLMGRPWPTEGCCAKNKQTNKQTNRLARYECETHDIYLPTAARCKGPATLLAA